MFCHLRSKMTRRRSGTSQTSCQDVRIAPITQLGRCAPQTEPCPRHAPGSAARSDRSAGDARRRASTSRLALQHRATWLERRRSQLAGEQGPHLAPSRWADWLPSHAQRVGLSTGGGDSPDASEEMPLPLDLHEGGCELLSLLLDPSPHLRPKLNPDPTLTFGPSSLSSFSASAHPHPLSPQPRP